MDKKPWGITVACLVFAITAVLSLYAGFTTSTAMTIENKPVQSYFLTNVEQAALGGTSIGLIVMGLLFAAAAWFLWKENELAWYFSVGLLGVSVVVDVISMAFFGLAATTAVLVAVAISVVVLLALLHEDTLSAVNPKEVEYKGWNLKALSS